MKELFVEPSEFLEKPYTDDQIIDALARLVGEGERHSGVELSNKE
jgi:hypothetical protein